MLGLISDRQICSCLTSPRTHLSEHVQPLLSSNEDLQTVRLYGQSTTYERLYMTGRIPVFFTERQSVPTNSSFSPSAGKPAIVAKALLELGYPMEIIKPRPLNFHELAKVHDEAYLRDVLTGKRSNGFGNTRMDVARSLPYTSGSMLAAVLAASPSLPAVSLSSGFHHACWNHGGGFCTFNGLAAAAVAVLDRGMARRVAIVDCDAHYGNGTDDILRHLPRLEDRILHQSLGRFGKHGDGYLAKLEEVLREVACSRPTRSSSMPVRTPMWTTLLGAN